VLDECVYWQVRLNLKQNLLGKLIIVLRRHEEQVAALSADEWNALHKQVRLMTARLRAAFEPDHFNYAFLQKPGQAHSSAHHPAICTAERRCWASVRGS
jgi:diadenosine tetraphosphate (Ap4A) HIT family hydrolase